MKRSVVFLAMALFAAVSCGTFGQYSGMQMFSDGVYATPTSQPAVLSKEDFARRAANNLAAEKSRKQRDTLVVLLDDRSAASVSIALGLWPAFIGAWRYGPWFYDPWWCGPYWGDPWFRPWHYYDPWYRPWGPYYPYRPVPYVPVVYNPRPAGSAAHGYVYPRGDGYPGASRGSGSVPPSTYGGSRRASSPTSGYRSGSSDYRGSSGSYPAGRTGGYSRSSSGSYSTGSSSGSYSGGSRSGGYSGGSSGGYSGGGYRGGGAAVGGGSHRR